MHANTAVGVTTAKQVGHTVLGYQFEGGTREMCILMLQAAEPNSPSGLIVPYMHVQSTNVSTRVLTHTYIHMYMHARMHAHY